MGTNGGDVNRPGMAQTVTFVENPNKRKRKQSPLKILCKGCSRDVGNFIYLGPEAVPLVACFDSESCSLIHPDGYRELASKSKWGMIMKSARFPKIVSVDMTSLSALVTGTLRSTGAIDHQELPLVRETFENESGEGAFNPCSYTVTRPRLYQMELALQALRGNSIIYLPTGTGKTLIAVIVMRHMLTLNPDKRLAFIVDRIPLVYQQEEYFCRESSIKSTTLTLSSATPQKVQNSTKFIFSTAQIFLNMLHSDTIRLSDFSLIIFDEAHHAKGNHPYTRILDRFGPVPLHLRPLILGLTASPVEDRTLEGTIESLLSLKKVFFADRIVTAQVFRSNLDDLTKHTDCSFFYTLPSEDENRLHIELERAMNYVVSSNFELQRYKPDNLLSFIEIRRLDAVLDKVVTDPQWIASNISADLLVQLQFMKQLCTAAEVNSVLGPARAIKFLQLNTDETFRGLVASAFSRVITTGHSAKLTALVRAVEETIKQKGFIDVRVLVFVNTRKTARWLFSILESEIPSLAPLRASLCVGHGGVDGMEWFGEQEQVLQKFRLGTCKLLVATSVVEEGLDVPACSLVIRFDPSRSFISFVQSRGRARCSKSQFIVICDARVEAHRSIEIFQRNLDNASEILCPDDCTIRELCSRFVNPSFSTPTSTTVVTAQSSPQRPISHLEAITSTDLSHSTRNTSSLSIGFCLQSKSNDEADICAHFSAVGAVVARKENLPPLLLLDVGNQSPFGVYQQLIRNPSLMHLHNQAIWMRRPHFRVHTRSTEGVQLPIMSIDFGVFDKLSAVFSPITSWEVNGISSFAGVEMLVTLNTTSTSQTTLHFTPLGLNDCVIFSHQLDSEAGFLFVHLPLRHCPLMVDSEGRRSAGNELPNRILQTLNFSSCLRLQFHFSNDGREEEALRSFWEDVGISVFDCMVKVGPEMENPTRSYSMQLFFDQAGTFTEELSVASRSSSTNENTVLVPVIVFTPTRAVLLPHQKVASNRIVRQYGACNFMIAHFRDENLDRLPPQEPLLQQRVSDILTAGMEISGKRFTFLGCSASQLRANSCWMCCLDSDSVREKMGDFSSIKCVGKYLSRIGLSFTSTTDVGCFEHSVIPDIEHGGFTFSDGIGKASLHVMQSIFRLQHLEEIPSAIQVRYSGCKGVLALDPTIPADGPQIAIRPSMIKFSSPLKMLELVGVAQSLPLYLNRQIIMLLSSLGVPDFSFTAILEKNMQLMDDILTNEEVAKMVLQRHTDLRVGALSAAGILFLEEPYLFRLIHAIYRTESKELRRRARLHVEKGATLMGTLDETRTLQERQVFVSYRGNTRQTGTVLVWKNPCLHPGDVQVFTAIDVPSLHHMHDCICFPSCGSRPHPNELSGSDLDGDLYCVCWDESLFPPTTHPPMESEPPAPREKNRPITTKDLHKFFVKYLANEQLGVISHAHLVLADRCDLGALDPRCISIAKMHSIEVDFPKTGLHVELPKELRPTSYPSYMEKSDRKSYVSSKVLQVLYDRCEGMVETQSVSEFLVHVQWAKGLYKEYCSQLHSTLRLYGCGTEAEIATACLDKQYSPLFSFQQAKGKFQNLQKYFAGLFNSSTCSDSPDVRAAKASAWYYVAYSSKKSILSFAWSIESVLTELIRFKLHQSGQPYIPNNSKTLAFAQSVFESLWHPSEQFTSYLDREAVVHSVKIAVASVLPSAEVHLYGSSSYFLFREDSDIDISISTSTCGSVEILTKILPHVTFFSPSAHINQAIPLIRAELHGFGVDITINSSGVDKCHLLRNYIASYPPLFLILHLISNWAHNAGLITHHKDSPFTTFGLCWAVIHFTPCLTSVLPSCSEIQCKGPQSDLEEWWKTVSRELQCSWRENAHLITSSVNQFLSNCAESKVLEVGLPDPIEKGKFIVGPLSGQNLSLVRKCASSAYHTILWCWNATILLELKHTNAVVRVPVSTISSFESISDLISCLTSFEKVNVKQLSIDSSVTVLGIEGEPRAVRACVNRLHQLASTCRLRGQLIFIQGSTVFLFQGSLFDSDKLGFTKYMGRKQPKHRGLNAHEVRLLAPVGGNDWEQVSYGKLRKTALLQFEALKQSSLHHSHVDFFVRFGRGYVMHLETLDSTEEINISALETSVSKEHNRKRYKEYTDRQSKNASSNATTEIRLTKKVRVGKPVAGDSSAAPKTTGTKKHKKKGPCSAFVTVFEGTLDDILPFLSAHGFNSEPPSKTYTTTMRLSQGHREYVGHLDSNFNCVELFLSRVQWLSAFHFLSHPGGIQPPCSRFSLVSTERVPEEDPLFVNLSSAPICVQQQGHIVVCSKLASVVTHIRIFDTCKIFCCQKNGFKIYMYFTTVHSESVPDTTGRFLFSETWNEIEFHIPLRDTLCATVLGDPYLQELCCRTLWELTKQLNSALSPDTKMTEG
ncbi:RNA-dependent RNA polymerase 1 [Pelomyxa schiedti]|nr:RNA-dependent RNA polymerase 1 [Pelomyxa schiedti]